MNPFSGSERQNNTEVPRTGDHDDSHQRRHYHGDENSTGRSETGGRIQD